MWESRRSSWACRLDCSWAEHPDWLMWCMRASVMVSSMLCTATPSCRGSMVPVQKEKAPDGGWTRWIFPDRDFSRRTAIPYEENSSQIWDRNLRLTLTCKHRGYLKMQRCTQICINLSIPYKIYKILGQTQPSVLSHVVKGTIMRHIDGTGPFKNTLFPNVHD